MIRHVKREEDLHNKPPFRLKILNINTLTGGFWSDSAYLEKKNRSERGGVYPKRLSSVILKWNNIISKVFRNCSRNELKTFRRGEWLRWVTASQTTLHSIVALPRLFKTGSYKSFAAHFCTNPKIRYVNVLTDWYQTRRVCHAQQSMTQVNKTKESIFDDLWQDGATHTALPARSRLQMQHFSPGWVATFICGASGGETCHLSSEECSVTCTPNWLVCDSVKSNSN